METILKTKSRWSEKELDFLRENYGKINNRKIGEILDRSIDAVQLKARKIGLGINSKYNFNKNFFKVIDTHDKAYWLGFIYADGYVIYNKDKRNYEFGIMLQKRDSNHLRKFNKSIEGNFSINYRDRETYMKSDNNRLIKSSVCEIRVYSIDMVEDLMSHGVYTNKTYKDMKLPNLSDELMWSFIRGYLDGDGHISVPKENKKYGYNIGFTCIYKPFLDELKTFLEKFGIKPHVNLSRKEDMNKNTKNCYQLVIRNKESIKIFIEKAYENKDVYLDRKYSNYLKLQCAL